MSQPELDEAPVALEEAPVETSTDVSDPSDIRPTETDPDAIEETPDSTVESEGDPDASPTATAPPAPAAPPAPNPLRVRYFGRDGDDPEFALDGAVRHADGRIEIPPGKSSDRALQLLGRGREYERVAVPRIQQLEREVQQVSTQFSEDVARGNALWQFYNGLAQQDPEVQQAWWQDFMANRPLLEAAVEREVARQQYDAARRLREPSPDQVASQQTAQVEQAQSVFWSVLQAERAKHPQVSDEQLAEIAGEMWDDIGALTQIANHDDPARGVVRGQPAFDLSKIAKRMEKEVRYRGASIPSTTPASTKVQQNARVVASAAPPSPKLPQATPPAPTTGTPSQPRNADGTFKTRADYERYLANKYRL